MQSADCVPCSLQTAYLAPCSLQTAQVLRLHATSLFKSEHGESHQYAIALRRKHKQELQGSEHSHFPQFLHVLLDTMVFENPGSGFFHAIGGLAMDGKLSGTMTTLAVYRYENDHICHQHILFSPWPYVRYTDDTGTLAKNAEHAEYML